MSEDLDALLKYPGSKRNLRSVYAATAKKDREVEARDTDVWGDPIVKYIAGNPLNLYRIGGLARALGRTVYTIRQWEAEGRIPPAPYLWRGTGPRGASGNRRYYTETAIRSAVDAFDAEGLLEDVRIDWSSEAAERVSAAIAAAWAAEVEQYN